MGCKSALTSLPVSMNSIALLLTWSWVYIIVVGRREKRSFWLWVDSLMDNVHRARNLRPASCYYPRLSPIVTGSSAILPTFPKLHPWWHSKEPFKIHPGSCPRHNPSHNHWRSRTNSKSIGKYLKPLRCVSSLTDEVYRISTVSKYTCQIGFGWLTDSFYKWTFFSILSGSEILFVDLEQWGWKIVSSFKKKQSPNWPRSNHKREGLLTTNST